MTANYVRQSWVDTVGTGGASRLFYGGLVAPGAVAYVILFQAELASAAAPVPTVVAGAAATGAMPMNMAYAGALMASFLGKGIEAGLPYFDVRESGIASTTYSALYLDSTANTIPATGQAWGSDFRIKRLAGVVSGATTLKIYKGGVSTTVTTASLTPDATIQYAAVTSVTESGVTYLRPYVNDTVVAGVAYDFTLRIYVPKLCQLAVVGGAAGYMPTYPILPPVSVPGDSVRYADVVRAVADDTQPFSRWEAAGLSERASVIVSLDLFHVGENKARPLFEISDGSLDNYVRAFLNNDDQATLEIVAGGVVQASVALTAPVAVGTSLFVCTWTADGGYICDDRGQVASVPSVALPTGLTHMQVGGSLTTTYLDDTVRQIQACLPLTQSEAAFWTQMA